MAAVGRRRVQVLVRHRPKRGDGQGRGMHRRCRKTTQRRLSDARMGRRRRSVRYGQRQKTTKEAACAGAAVRCTHRNQVPRGGSHGKRNGRRAGVAATAHSAPHHQRRRGARHRSQDASYRKRIRERRYLRACRRIQPVPHDETSPDDMPPTRRTLDRTWRGRMDVPLCDRMDGNGVHNARATAGNFPPALNISLAVFSPKRKISNRNYHAL